MKIRKLKIHNFRAILDAEITLYGYGLLVGPNNGGKSTVIDAIRVFYEKDGFKFDAKNDFPRSGARDEESWIEIEYELTAEEHGQLKDDYKLADKRLRLRKFLQTDMKTPDGKTRAGFIFATTVNGNLSDESFYGARNVQSGKIGDIIHVPAVSKVDEQTKLTGPSPLRDLLSKVLAEVARDSDVYKKFSESVGEFSAGIKTAETADNRSLEKVEGEINEHLKTWGVDFALSVNTPNAAEIIKSMVVYDLTDAQHGQKQSVEYFGSGFQRHFIFSLIQVAAAQSISKVKPDKKEFSPEMTLLLFEEPEAFLHPPQQDILARSLMQFGNQNSRQVLCSTHSPHFVSRNSDAIPSIVHMRRKSAIATAGQISEAAWNSIVDANQAINAIVTKYPALKAQLDADDSKPLMEALKHFLWLNADRCGLFFADHALLVEGPSEVALINKLIGEGKINVNCGLYVLDCIGKFNIHRFMNLLSALGIPHSVIHDEDPTKAWHADINALIAASATTGLTHKIEVLKPDLEGHLGVPACTATHRKPQHLLYCVETGKADSANLDAFCSMVEGCVPIPATK